MSRNERGAATLLVAVALLVLGLVTALLVLAGVARATGERARGAADLAALAGAEALALNRDACAAARASAAANGSELTDCAVVGDEVEYAVSVSVRARLAVADLEHGFAAHANAGVVTEDAGVDP